MEDNFAQLLDAHWMIEAKNRWRLPMFLSGHAARVPFNLSARRTEAAPDTGNMPDTDNIKKE
ncbi:MAG: hypothetical protein ACI9UU_000161 [Candidatus Azotimanducaceae bacterium]|jgi:hypothetical protein